MEKIIRILEKKDILDFLDKRLLISRYKKSKESILKWLYSWIDFKLRQPKSNWIYSFRINKQFRAFWRLEEDWTLIIYEINNHQNY